MTSEINFFGALTFSIGRRLVHRHGVGAVAPPRNPQKYIVYGVARGIAGLNETNRRASRTMSE